VDLARGKWQCMYKEERNFDTLHNSVGRMPAWCNEPSVHFALVRIDFEWLLDGRARMVLNRFIDEPFQPGS
jgi:hypothetical protein